VIKKTHAFRAPGLALSVACLGVLALISASAHAGFIDDRSPEAQKASPSAAAAAPAATPAAAAASVAPKDTAPIAPPKPSVVMPPPAGSQPVAQQARPLPSSSFSGPGWADPAPTAAAAAGISLSGAIAVIYPPSLGVVSIEAADELLTRRVSWPAGLTRGQAMDHVALHAKVQMRMQAPGVMTVSSDPRALELSEIHAGAKLATQAALPAAEPIFVQAPAQPQTPAAVVAPSQRVATTAVPQPAPQVDSAAKPAIGHAHTAAALPSAAAPSAPSAPVERVVRIVEPTLKHEYTVSPSDANFRHVLMRWAQMAGWTFDSVHWALAKDIPVAAGANLGTDFKAAVRALLDSTTLTSSPARPCFYSNVVLRVVPRQEQCDRAGVAAAAN
jgi:hypothetical protein